MKKIIFMALFAATLSACSNENNEVTQETTNLKSLDFSFDVATPKTRMSDDEVTTAITAVRSNIQNITIEYFNASDASLGTYDFTPEQVATAKGDDQTAAAAGRKPVNISNIPSATTKVNVYMNVDKSAADINDLQIGYTKMEYRGTPEDITLKTPGGERTDGSTNDLYSVEVSVAPVLSRFEFHGKASDIKVNSSASGILPSGVADGTKDQAKAHVSDATITAPMSGTVIGTPLKAGQTISTGISTQMIIATIADLSDLEIYLTVDETDIGSIKQGAKVEFTVDSKPGETFTGYVSEIAKGTKGNMGATSNSVVYYTVKVQIPENISNNFLPSMTARATIFGEDIKNTLVVPLTAVRTDKQGEYVYVIKDGQPVRTAVSTGVTGDTNVQILKGLSEGDEIIVSGDVNAPKNNVAGPF